MFDQFSEGQLLQAFGLIAFVSVWSALFLYFALFPVTQDIHYSDSETELVIRVDPLALEATKLWNGASQGTSVVAIDSCNNATRVSEFVWQVELKAC